MSGKNVDELEQLRRSDARYRAVLLASAAIVWIASPEGEFVVRRRRDGARAVHVHPREGRKAVREMAERPVDPMNPQEFGAVAERHGWEIVGPPPF